MALATPFRKIVVTDEAGRYLVPDLPGRIMSCGWRLRLVDSPPVAAHAGRSRRVAGCRRARRARGGADLAGELLVLAVEVPPETSSSRGPGPNGNGIAPEVVTQHQSISTIKAGCNVCHQLGDLATREIPQVASGRSGRSGDAWDMRTQAGRTGTAMISAINGTSAARGAGRCSPTGPIASRPARCRRCRRARRVSSATS